MDFPHKPDLIGICILDFDKNRKAKLVIWTSSIFQMKQKIIGNDFL